MANRAFVASLLLCAACPATATVVRRDVLWSGDARGGDTDSYSYDITYDEPGVCPGEIRTPSIRNYILMGSILEVSQVSSSHECAMKCLNFQGCGSANYYFAAKALAGQCELLLERQDDNPTWMLPLHGATYLEAFCDDGDSMATELPQYTPPPKKGNFLKDLIRKLKNMSIKPQ